MSDLSVVCGFVGTLCETPPSYCLNMFGHMKSYVSTSPIHTTVRMLMGFRQSGCNIIIIDYHTNQYRSDITDWLKTHGVKFDYLVLPTKDNVKENTQAKCDLIQKITMEEDVYGKILCGIDANPNVCDFLAQIKSRPFVYHLNRRGL